MLHCAKLILLGVVFNCLLPSAFGQWKGGVATANITPKLPMPMAGYASRGAKHATGTLTDLWAKTLVIQSPSGNQAVLITLDIVGIERGLSQQICQQVQREFKLSRDQVAIATSHTHTGPVVAKTLRPMHYMMLGADDRQRVDDYAQYLTGQVLRSVAAAFADIGEAEFAWGSGKATFAVNRRENREADVVELREKNSLQGPSDHDVPVLRMRRLAKRDAIVFGYACHSTTLSKMEWSGDYPGFAQIALEERYPDSIAMFWAGCGGDQNPVPRRTVELAKKYGGELAEAVAAVIEQPMMDVDGDLSTQYIEQDLPLADLPTEAELRDQAASPNKYVKSRADSLLKQIADGIELSPTYPYPIQFWKLGSEVQWVFLGGEVVVDYAIRLKSELNRDGGDFSRTWVAAYSNDVMAYIPSRRVLLEGGYEGGGAMIYYGLPTVWAPEVEQVIVQATCKLSD
ncbi:MAG: neutral/alkaline non-lysosomal ceramidase N-terminal domain-containing protein [Rubripirellula sp.]